MEHKKNILIGCTGSVAAIKLPVVLNLLKKRDQTFQVSAFYGSLIFLFDIETSPADKSRLNGKSEAFRKHERDLGDG